MKALLMGYYGARNLGDEMMLVCLRRWLEAQDVSLTVLSECPPRVERDHGLPAIRNWPLLGEWSWRGSWFKGGAIAVLKQIARHDALIVGGGDLIRDDLGWRGFLFPIEKIAAALLLRKRVYFVNVGIGRPRATYAKALLRWTLARAEQIIARDLRSVDVCRECGAGDRVVLAPDIVGTLSSIPTVADSRKPYVIVALREASAVFGQCDLTAARLAGLAAALDAFIDQHDVDVVFVPFQSGEIHDADIHARVVALMQRRERIVNREWTADVSAICALFAGARGVLAMRLHAAVLAVAFDRPCVVLPYDHKLREFVRLQRVRCLEPPDLENASAQAALADWLTRPASPAAANTLDDDARNGDWNSLRLTATPHPPAADSRFVNSPLTKETTP